jgi:hypothetical protein
MLSCLPKDKCNASSIKIVIKIKFMIMYLFNQQKITRFKCIFGCLFFYYKKDEVLLPIFEN